jgi:Nuclease-related domain
VWHDIARPGGYNFDHVVVGPPGIFLLDTKNYLGEASIQDGELRVKWLEDPDDGWTRKGLTNRMRGASFELKRWIETTTGARHWVQPVVVLWQSFPERIVEVSSPSSVYFVHGDELVSWLRMRPAQPTVGVPAHRRSPRGCTRCRCSALDLLIRCDDPSANSHSWLACEVGGIRSSGAHYE